MAEVWIPLQGPEGVRPKAPAVGAWQSPGYMGVDMDDWQAGQDNWYGLRCDNLVVIDCDDADAVEVWQKACGGQDSFVRKTPRGYHYIYEWTEGSPCGPHVGVWPHIDIRAGAKSQIVYWAPGYENITSPADIQAFDPSWLPESLGTSQVSHDSEAWSEMPDGRGNNTMAAFAGAFRKQGMDMLTICKCLGAINAITMTQDPMPDTMIVDIARSICRYKAEPDVDLVVE